MKNKVFIIIVLIMSFVFPNNKAYFAQRNIDLFNEIIENTDSQILEYGVRVSLGINEDGEEYCLDILRKLQVGNANINVVKQEKIYCVEFSNKELKGYIESSSYDNHNVVIMNITQINSENKLSELKDKIKSALGETDKEAKYFQYLKAKVNNNDKFKVNEDIKNILKEYKAVNIDTVKIENGYSTVAYTKKYSAMKNNGKWMDFNYAVCSYDSGDYIILGTPIIITTY
jgi:hypothetical protein